MVQKTQPWGLGPWTSYRGAYSRGSANPRIIEKVAGGFAPKRVRTHRVHTHIDSTSDHVIKISLSLTEKKDNIVDIMKQNNTKQSCLVFVL